MVSRCCLRRNCLVLSLVAKSKSTLASSNVAGIKYKLSNCVGIIQSLTSFLFNNKSLTLFTTISLSIPTPLVVFPCGSISTNNTFLPLRHKEADKFKAVVVFPTPPL